VAPLNVVEAISITLKLPRHGWRKPPTPLPSHVCGESLHGTLADFLPKLLIPGWRIALLKTSERPDCPDNAFRTL